jgi:ribosomal protein S18 acetylase RimI-like enzyme
MLMRELERRLRSKRCPKVNLQAVSTNEMVCASYQSLGHSKRNLVLMD